MKSECAGVQGDDVADKEDGVEILTPRRRRRVGGRPALHGELRTREVSELGDKVRVKEGELELECMEDFGV